MIRGRKAQQCHADIKALYQLMQENTFHDNDDKSRQPESGK